MNISYYTIDDLRLPPKRSLRKGRSVEQFSTLEEALARYQSLPAAGIRVLGLTDGIHVLELVKCLPLFPDDQEGEDVLASDYSCFPLWAQEPEAASATGACITAMGLRYPTFLVDKVKDELQKVIDLLESGETDTEVIQETLDEAVCGINDLQEEFDENDSEIETVARDCIGVTVAYILEWFGIPIDIEEAIRERDW